MISVVVSVNLYSVLIGLLIVTGCAVIAADLFGPLASGWHSVGAVCCMIACTLYLRRALCELNERELRAFEMGQEFSRRPPLRRVIDGS